jgi:nuclear GTP-binding protein
VDIVGTARSIIQDWNSGKIAYYSIPPETPASSHLSAEVVQQWSNEFKISEFTQSNVLQAASVSGNNFMAVVSQLLLDVFDDFS